jgi:glycosyltransferase involved in cell wall biosynthesis
MRLAIDAHMVGERETGNETYTLNLIKSLIDEFPRHSYQVFTCHHAYLKPHLAENAGATLIEVPRNPFRRIPFAIPRHLRQSRAQLLHVNYIAPPRINCPVVVTIHDISYEFHPEFFSLRDRLLLSTLVPFSARRAAAIIAVSQKTRSDLISRYRIPPEKITVTYEGADVRFRPLDKLEATDLVLKKYGIDRAFVLTLGNLQPRKNLPRLVQAYAKLKREQKLDAVLVIAGQALWRESKVFRAVRDTELETDVIFTGYIPDEDLPWLYNAARLFVFPSLYEGFGLPPLEAMACGTPVACSRMGALPEVVADAALTFDPRSVDEMARVILQVASSPDLQAHLSERGQQRAQRFSWKAMAHETMEVYQNVVSSNSKSHG